MNKQTMVYVSGPYRAKTFFGVLRNIWKARKLAITLWYQGYAVFCPHTNTILFPEGARSNKHKINYIHGDLTMISRMQPGLDFIIMCSGWEKSAGAKIEQAFAKAQGLEIRYEK